MKPWLVTLPEDLARAVDNYLTADWSKARDPSRMGALNAVAYIGERVAALRRAGTSGQSVTLERLQRMHADAEAAFQSLPSLGGILEAVAGGQAQEVGQALNEVSRLIRYISDAAREMVRATGGEQ